MLTVILILLPTGDVPAQIEGQPEFDSTGVIPFDTLSQPLQPIPFIGALDRVRVMQALPDSEKNMMDYTYVGDLFQREHGTFIRALGAFGQRHALTTGGVDEHGVAVMIDGKPTNDPLTGTPDPYLPPTEHIERLEVIRGTRAFLYGLNSTGAVVNVVTRSRKALKPFSRIRYSESTYGNGFFDGLISQDLIRGLNLQAGLQRISLGGKFRNTGCEAWNARFSTRYNLNPRINFFLTELYSQTQVGLNGGIDSTTPPDLRFEGLQARVRNEDSYEKTSRHDISAGAALRLFPDTNAVTTAAVHLTTSLREYRDEENRPAPNGFLAMEDHRTQILGFRGSQHITIGNVSLDAGAEVRSLDVIGSPSTGRQHEIYTAFYGKAELSPVSTLHVGIFGRSERFFERDRLSFGTDLACTPLPWLEFSGGYSLSHRYPTFQELLWRDSTIAGIPGQFVPERHRLVEGGIHFTPWDNIHLALLGGHRRIENKIAAALVDGGVPFPFIEYRTLHRQDITSVSLTADIRIWVLSLEGTAEHASIAGDRVADLEYPRWHGSTALYYRNRVFKDHLDLKTGFRTRFISGFNAPFYNPRIQVFIPQDRQQTDASFIVDFLLLAHLGDAYLHIVWENLANRDYTVTTFYPMPDRAVRFGISWEFFD